MILFKNKLKVPIYDIKITFMIADQLSEIMKNLNIDYDLSHCDAACVTLKEDNYTEYALIFETKALTISNISHECIHVTNKIMIDIGQEADYHNDEVYAYLNGWIIGEFMGKIELEQLIYLLKIS